MEDQEKSPKMPHILKVQYRDYDYIEFTTLVFL